MRKGAFDTLLEFHSNIVRCCVSAWYAVSLYHGISEKGKMVAWEIDGRRNFMKREKASGCVNKYVEGGFGVVLYKRKMVGPKEPEVDDLDVKLP